MRKVLLKLYLKGKIKPLFECEITNDVEKTIKDLQKDLNDRNIDVVCFGQVGFARSEFKYFEIFYK